MKKKTLCSYFILLLTVVLLSSCNKFIINNKNNENIPQELDDISTNANTTDADNNEQNITNPDQANENKSTITPFPSIEKSMNKECYPKVDGSTATIPLSLAVYQFATGATHSEAESTIVHTKTTNSYLSLIDGTVDLLIVYEPSKEVNERLASSTVKLNIKPIGKDALVFITNQANVTNSLTGKEIVDIYSGKITNWKEVGGEDKEIIPFQRPDSSGSQTLMNKLVMKDTKIMDAPYTFKPSSMGEIISSIAEYSNENNALGYSVFYYTQNMNKEPLLKYIAINEITPSKETIKDGTYPYVNEFYAVIREDEELTSNAHIIFDWLTSPEGQLLIDKLGYVPFSKKEVFLYESRFFSNAYINFIY
jgi:ABC-type phosphate transport system substrate-binding protein